MREGRELVSGRSAEHAPCRGLAPCRATPEPRPGARSERGSGPEVEESRDGGVLQLSRELDDVADDESDADGTVQRTGDLVVAFRACADGHYTVGTGALEMFSLESSTLWVLRCVPEVFRPGLPGGKSRGGAVNPCR